MREIEIREVLREVERLREMERDRDKREVERG